MEHARLVAQRAFGLLQSAMRWAAIEPDMQSRDFVNSAALEAHSSVRPTLPHLLQAHHGKSCEACESRS
jgi:hypothetical protein